MLCARTTHIMFSPLLSPLLLLCPLVLWFAFRVPFRFNLIPLCGHYAVLFNVVFDGREM